MKYINIIVLLFLSMLLYGEVYHTDWTFDSNLSPIQYGFGYWTENGHGNHRAVVMVDEQADCVISNIEWRRYDKNPEEKGVIVQNEQGETVNSKVISIGKIMGEVAFEAKTPGKYYIYYMPYTPSSAYSIDKTEYYPNICNADKDWLHRNNLNNIGNIVDFPKAKVLKIESRSENYPGGNYLITWNADYDRDAFYSMYPMLITVSDEELKTFNNIYKNEDFLLFCEDRTNPIKMLHEIPYKWYKCGENKFFKGAARPNEIYVFQIGVYALKEMKNLKLTVSDFKCGDYVIKSSDVHCINLGGNDYLGNHFDNTVDVLAGDVEPLWFYVQMPKDVKGSFIGEIGVSATGINEKKAKININVHGDVLEDGGVSESWRMSRISWLDSKIAIDDTVPLPYKPVKVIGNKVSVLGREVAFSEIGFPKTIKSNNICVIDKEFDFGVYKDGQKLAFNPVSKKVLKKSNVAFEEEYISRNDILELSVIPKIEFDGCISYKVILKALKDVDLSDIVLNVPYNKDVAKYSMGMSMKGQRTPKVWDWKWSNLRADYLLWIGDYNAGMQIKLEPSDHAYRFGGFFDIATLPKGWYNDNKGGAKLEDNFDVYNFKAYTGTKSLKAGESEKYDFRLLITPFKPFDEKRYEYRTGSGADIHTNSHLVFQSEPGNVFINYPFLEPEYIKGIVNGLKDKPTIENSSINYKIQNTDSTKGSVTLWIKSSFDWDGFPSQRSLVDVNFGNERLGLYFNKTLKEMQVYSFKRNELGAAIFKFTTPFLTEPRFWKKGDEHIVTLTWGDTVKVYIDGELVNETGMSATVEELQLDDITIFSEFADYKGIRVDNEEILNNNFEKIQNTVLFDNFDKRNKKGDFVPILGEIGRLNGEMEKINDYISANDAIKKTYGVDIYYTSRELSNHCYEIWALKALKDEIFDNKGLVYTYEGAKELTDNGGGYQWLNEQLQDGYIPAWHTPLSEGEHCAAISIRNDCRWLNFYIAGLDYVTKEYGVLGIYLDGIGYNREITKRMSRIMNKNCGLKYNMVYHSGNNYDYLDWKANVLNTTMEHVPFMTNLYIGEGFDYDESPDYWFTEISGIPFGVHSEMLQYQNGGNPYRGMLYGMTGRWLFNGYLAMLRFWDNWGIEKSECIGYWDKKPLAEVLSNNTAGEILATVYKQKGKALIAIGSWSDKDEMINIKLNYKELGINPKNVEIEMPDIWEFQEWKELKDLNNIEIKAGKGCLIMINEK